MDINEVSLSSPIDKKIAWAEYCYFVFRGKIFQDKTIVGYLSRLKHAIHASHKQMADTDIVQICRMCERDEGGSCCGAGLENKYDGWLLLSNLLLGAQLPKKRYDPRSCFFLGKKGCLLKARHVICVNYICKKITDQIEPHKLSALREKEGDELDTLFHLNERLKHVLRA